MIEVPIIYLMLEDAVGSRYSKEFYVLYSGILGEKS